MSEQETISQFTSLHGSISLKAMENAAMAHSRLKAALNEESEERREQLVREAIAEVEAVMNALADGFRAGLAFAREMRQP